MKTYIYFETEIHSNHRILKSVYRKLIAVKRTFTYSTSILIFTYEKVYSYGTEIHFCDIITDLLKQIFIPLKRSFAFVPFEVTLILTMWSH